MRLHANAKTTPLSRREIVRRLRRGHPIQQVARDYGLSRVTVRKWLKRWIEEGPRGLLDRSSAPAHVPRRTPRSLERRIEQLRRKRWVAWQIAYALKMAISTVSAVLKRLGLGRLSSLNEKPPTPYRYEREQPGELLHVDTKKLARIGAIGHRIHGRRSDRSRGIGWEYVHVCVDDHTRLAYAEVLSDEKSDSCTAFLRRAVAWLRQQGIRPERVMTDNGSAYNSRLWAARCQELEIRPLKTRPYTPRTNGKAERFIQTLTRQWAYATAFKSSARRRQALPAWLSYYNDQRPHRSLGMNPPRQRLLGCLEQPT